MTTTRLLALLNTRGPFEEWLRSIPPDAVVGQQNLSCSCPVARFLLDNGYDKVKVGNFFDLSTIEAGDEHIETPDWLLDFLSRVDEDTAPYERAARILGETVAAETSCHEVTAQIALDVLAEVERKDA